MNTLAVVGLQWGDEGKGKIVDMLAAAAAHVARFQGGHNAGHTLVANGEKTALHLLPCGVLHSEAKCYIGGGVVVSPLALLEELAQMRAAGISLDGRLFVANSAALVLPYHALLDGRRESRRTAKIGTTLRGIGPAHEDKIARRAVRFYDLYNGDGREKVFANAALYSDYLGEKLDADSLWRDLENQAEKLHPFIRGDIGEMLAAAATRGERILLEGAQGAMLDVECGTYPFVTSAQCLPSFAAAGLGVELSPFVLGACKAYSTRVGNGPFPTELHCDTGAKLAEVGEELGATTGRKRRCGWLDAPMLRRAAALCNCRNIALTKLDVLDCLDEIPVCTAYDLDGETVFVPPADPRALARCRPIYETLPGWKGESAANIREESQLPANARRYIRRIEELLHASAALISTGPARLHTITRRELFAD